MGVGGKDGGRAKTDGETKEKANPEKYRHKAIEVELKAKAKVKDKGRKGKRGDSPRRDGPRRGAGNSFTSIAASRTLAKERALARIHSR